MSSFTLFNNDKKYWFTDKNINLSNIQSLNLCY